MVSFYKQTKHYERVHIKFRHKTKRKKSDSVLRQKPLHKRKTKKQRGKTKRNKCLITQRLRTDLRRSVWVTTHNAIQLLLLNWIIREYKTIINLCLSNRFSKMKLGVIVMKIIMAWSIKHSYGLNHRRPFNAWWRLLEISELTPRKYIYNKVINSNSGKNY